MDDVQFIEKLRAQTVTAIATLEQLDEFMTVQAGYQPEAYSHDLHMQVCDLIRSLKTDGVTSAIWSKH